MVESSLGETGRSERPVYQRIAGSIRERIASGELGYNVEVRGTSGVWNVRDDSAPWVAEYTEVVDRHAGDTPRHRTMRWRTAMCRVPRDMDYAACVNGPI